MKTYKSSLFSLLFVSLSMFGLTAMAVTPDEETPAEETVCGPLRADDVTKGLYGLCVAFCEGQDISSEDFPITEADLSALQEAAPSGRILANYNKKKQTTDPDMPCIKVEEPCPCWTAAEFASIDGAAPDGELSETSCNQAIDPATGLIDARQDSELDPSLVQATAFDVHRPDIQLEQCSYQNNQVTPPITRKLDVSEGTLTHEQAATCLAQVNIRCAELGHGVFY